MDNENIKPLSDHAKTHVNVWKYGQAVHSPLLLAMATEEDYPGLLGFFEALDAGALNHSRLRMSKIQHLEAEGLTNNYFRQRGQLLDNTSELNLPFMEILALPLSSKHSAISTTTSQTARPEQRKYFDYAMDVLGRLENCDRKSLTDQERSLPSIRDRFIAAIVGFCKDPEIVSDALNARGSIEGDIYARHNESDRQDSIQTNLTRLAASWANPVSMNVLMNEHGVFKPRVDEIYRDSVGQEMLDSFVLAFGNAPIYTDYEAHIAILANELDRGIQNDEYSLTNALRILFKPETKIDSTEARQVELVQPIVHSEMLRKSMRRAAKNPEAWKKVTELLMSMVPGDMNVWYTKPIKEDDRLTIKTFYKEIADQTYQTACFTGNAKVTSALSQYSLNMIEKFENESKEEKRIQDAIKNRVITRLGDTVEKMVEQGNHISLSDMLQTVDAMIESGYDLETFQERKKIEERFGYVDAPQSTLIHRLARAIHKDSNHGMDLLTHLVIKGADPHIKSGDHVTIENCLRNKDLRNEWKRISRGLAAKDAAMDVMEELGIFSQSP